MAIDDLGWARDVLASAKRPVPGRPWKLSVGGMIGRHPRVPKVVRKLLRLLDDFGAVVIGPSEVGFDGKTVKWEKVLEVRLHSTADLLPDVVVDREIDRIRDFLPPVPGRKWAVTKITETLLVLIITARGNGDGESVIPCEIVYRNLLGRPSEIPAGLFAAAILAGLPEAGECLLVTARQKGIPIVEVPPTTTRSDRAERLRKASTRLADRVRSLQTSGED
jgi:hypothetical protein